MGSAHSNRLSRVRSFTRASQRADEGPSAVGGRERKQDGGWGARGAGGRKLTSPAGSFLPPLGLAFLLSVSIGVNRWLNILPPFFVSFVPFVVQSSFSFSNEDRCRSGGREYTTHGQDARATSICVQASDMIRWRAASYSTSVRMP